MSTLLVATPTKAPEIIDFTAERSRYDLFLAREDVLAAVDRHVVSGAPSGWVLITGGPGLGKSALLARRLELAEQSGRRTPHHFLRRGVADWAQPEAAARSLAAQIEALYPEQVDLQANPQRRLLELITRVSRDGLVSKQERLLVVIDGLDEAASASGDNPLPLFLPHSLPPGVWVLCASRAKYPHLAWIESRDNVLRIDLDDAAWSGSNDAVCRAYWEREAPRFAPPLDAALVTEILEAGGGNILYAVKLREWLGGLPAGQRRAERLPRGLEALLEQWWDELRRLPAEQRATAFTGLGVLCAAREALPSRVLGEVAGWSGSESTEDFMQAVRPFLLEQPAPWAGDKAYRLYHESFREFVARKRSRELREHHKRLSDTIAKWPSMAEDTFGRRYALRHVVAHALEAGEKEKAGDLWAALQGRSSGVSLVETRSAGNGRAGVQQATKRGLGGGEDRAAGAVFEWYASVEVETFSEDGVGENVRCYE